MDFSTLFSAENFLYIIGGSICVVLFIIVVLIKVFKNGPAESAPLVVGSATPTPVTESQSLSKEEQILPSTEVIDAAPVVVATNAATPAIEVSKGEIPPMSSWKPSQEAAPIQSEDTQDTPPTTIEESVKATS